MKALGIAVGLNYIHSLGILHCDMKYVRYM